MRFRRQSQGGCCGSILGMGIFLAAGIGLSIWGWIILQNARASTSWPSVEGQIISSEVSVSSDTDGGTSYGADVTYNYTVNDQGYSGDKVTFGEYSSSNKSRAQAIVNRYPPGSSVPVYYNPAAPGTSVLEPGVTWSSYIILGMGVLFAGIGLLFGPLALLSRRR